jgi:hypothetical protein
MVRIAACTVRGRAVPCANTASKIRFHSGMPLFVRLLNVGAAMHLLLLVSRSLDLQRHVRAALTSISQFAKSRKQ